MKKSDFQQSKVGLFDEKHILFKNIHKHVTLDKNEMDFLKSVFFEETVAKKNILLRQGQICRNIYFILSGSIRAYYQDDDGKESTIMFGIKDWWITDMYAFSNQKPALLTLETLENSKVVNLSHTCFETVIKKVPKLERYFRILFQKAYVREQLRVLDTISKPTEERYALFTTNYPEILEKVTQKQIASYLGVTPEFLSAVKKK